MGKNIFLAAVTLLAIFYLGIMNSIRSVEIRGETQQFEISRNICACVY